MSVRHSSITTDTTAKRVSAFYPRSAGEGDVTMSILVSNEGAVDVLLGGEGVTSADYGYKVPAGGSITLDLTYNDVLYAVAASGTAVVRVLYSGV